MHLMNLNLDDLWFFQTHLSVLTEYFPQILCPVGV